MSQVAFIGYASGWGAQVRETEKGPSSLLHSEVLSSLTIPWIWKETLSPLKYAEEIHLPPGSQTLPYIEDLSLRTALSVKILSKIINFPL